jgi:cytochrome c oxidase subunit II
MNRSVAPMKNLPANKRSARLNLALVGLTAGLLASCAKDAPQDTWQPKGTNARWIDNLQRAPFAIAGIVLVIVVAFVGVAVWRFRDRGQEMPEQSHGKPAVEIVLTVLPALILVGIGIPTWGTIMDLAKTSDTECVINVTGQQWWWEYDIPAQAGCGGISAPIITSGDLVIPTDTNILLRISSRDVIHSYWIPALNGKRDAVPGRVQTLRMQADQPGIYPGQCTEFCGLSHSNMKMQAIGLDKADFATWVARQLSDYQAPAADSPAGVGEKAFISSCSRCHQVNGLANSDGSLVISRPDLNIYSGAAPNLTHLMSRVTFAGGTFDLMTPACRSAIYDATPEEFGAAYLKGVSADCLNVVELRQWLRNAPAKKPMYADPTKLDSTGGLYRGMPNLNLTEDQIDQIIAYLIERK